MPSPSAAAIPAVVAIFLAFMISSVKNLGITRLSARIVSSSQRGADAATSAAGVGMHYYRNAAYDAQGDEHGHADIDEHGRRPGLARVLSRW